MSNFPLSADFVMAMGILPNHASKKLEEEVVQKKGDQWTQVQKSSSVKQGFKSKGQRGEMGSGSKPSG